MSLVDNESDRGQLTVRTQHSIIKIKKKYLRKSQQYKTPHLHPVLES